MGGFVRLCYVTLDAGGADSDRACGGREVGGVAQVTTLYLAVATFLLVNLGGGLLRILAGPEPADRMLAAQLFATTGVAVLIVLAAAGDLPGLRDVALVFALLGPVNAVVFASWRGRRNRPDGGS